MTNRARRGKTVIDVGRGRRAGPRFRTRLARRRRSGLGRLGGLGRSRAGRRPARSAKPIPLPRPTAWPRPSASTSSTASARPESHRPDLSSSTFPPLKLYLEDVRDVYETMARHGGHTQIEVDHRPLGGIEEMLRLPEHRVHRLEIRTDSPYQELNLGPDDACFKRDFADTSSASALSGVTNVLGGKERRIAGFLSRPPFPATTLVLASVVAVIALYALVPVRYLDNALFRLALGTAISSCLIGLLLLGLSYWVNKRGRVLIVTRRREGEPVWRRKSDEIAAAAVLGMATLLVVAFFLFLLTT